VSECVRQINSLQMAASGEIPMHLFPEYVCARDMKSIIIFPPMAGGLVRINLAGSRGRPAYFYVIHIVIGIVNIPCVYFASNKKHTSLSLSLSHSLSHAKSLNFNIHQRVNTGGARLNMEQPSESGAGE
jgi:hypothetical protein